MSRKVFAAAIAIVVALGVGISVFAVTKNARTDSIRTVAHVDNGGHCTVAESHADVIVRFSDPQFSQGEIDDYCDAWIRGSARRGTLWTQVAPQTRSPVCKVMISEKSLLGPGFVVATVMDTGQQEIGRRVCTRFISAGWNES